MSDTLPPLPESDYGLCFYDEGGCHPVDGTGYTADQMRSYAAAALAAERERQHEQMRQLMSELIFDEPAAVAEPVAWRSENANPPGGYVIFQQYPQALADLGKPIQPLYAAPPQREPLTKTEFARLWREHMGSQRFPDEAWIGKELAERAHGISAPKEQA